MEKGIEQYGLRWRQLEECGVDPVEDIDKRHEDETRHPYTDRRLPALLGKPLALPGPCTQKEIKDIEGQAGRLQDQEIQWMDPDTIGNERIDNAYASGTK